MINNLLATVFFRIDGLLLRSITGDAALGWYTTAYKVVDGVNVIPSNVTLALFPLLSRLSGDSSARLVRPTELALKALLSLALPISIGTTILADPLIRAFAGESYLPHSALALQLLVWLLPFSFVNGLLQYVLIAADQQRFITLSFLWAATFNVVANLLLIPTWGYGGAAVVTVASEVALLGPFWFAVQRYVGPVRLLAQAWRPTVAAALMAPVVWVLRDPAALLAIPAGILVYAGAYLAVGGFNREERAILRAAWPAHPARSVEGGAM
jgi:O-antigen/teichoic acid export membrane protein